MLISPTSTNDMSEEWRDVPGYEGLYQVSDMGRVKSSPRKGTDGRVLRPGRVNRLGHNGLYLYKDGKGKFFLTHRLVLLAFVGPPPSHCEVCHNNGDPHDNRLENLRYGTRSENCVDTSKMGHNKIRKLTDEQVQEIRRRLAEGEIGAHVAKDYGVHRDVVYRIRDGKVYAWLR